MKKILIIDDEIDLVDLLKIRFEARNYYIVPLYTSARAPEIIKREKPDLVLLDVFMPDKSGYEVCRELKSDKKTQHIPVILFTAKMDEKWRIKEDAAAAGADDYIIKPFAPADLIFKIEALFAK